MAWWWSWVLAVTGAGGMWVVGDKRRWGFMVLLGSEVLWVAYAFETRQWGFLPASVLWGGIFARNWLRWSP